MLTTYEECIKACQECLIDCKNCLIQMAGKESMNDYPTCCILCMETCNACISHLLANSPFTKEYCQLCSEICEWCAEQCGQHPHEHCAKCAESCTICAEACRKMAKN